MNSICCSSTRFVCGFSFCEKLCKPGASFPINLQVDFTRLENSEDGGKNLRGKKKTLTIFYFPSLAEFIDIAIDSSMYDMNEINLYIGHVQVLYIYGYVVICSMTTKSSIALCS